MNETIFGLLIIIRAILNPSPAEQFDRCKAVANRPFCMVVWACAIEQDCLSAGQPADKCRFYRNKKLAFRKKERFQCPKFHHVFL